MKKKKMMGLLGIIMVTVVIFNLSVNLKKTSLTLISLANIEALAFDENDDAKGAQSAIVTDLGTYTECINETLYRVNKYSINCIGTGNLSCKNSEQEIMTPIAKCILVR